jgi:integrase/recombinase XerD
MKLTELEFHLEDFLVYCQNKNLSTKTTGSYEQSLKLFLAYLRNEYNVDGVEPPSLCLSVSYKYKQLETK